MKATRLDHAEREIRWLFDEAAGDACGMHAAHYRALEAFSEGAAVLLEDGGVLGTSKTERRSRSSWESRDPYTDEDRRSRRRLREVSEAMRCLTPVHKSVLEAFFDRSRPNRADCDGLEAGYVEVAAMLVEVVVRARKQGITRLQAARRAIAHQGASAIRAKCAPIVDEALSAFARARAVAFLGLPL